MPGPDLRRVLNLAAGSVANGNNDSEVFYVEQASIFQLDIEWTKGGSVSLTVNILKYVPDLDAFKTLNDLGGTALAPFSALAADTSQCKTFHASSTAAVVPFCAGYYRFRAVAGATPNGSTALQLFVNWS